MSVVLLVLTLATAAAAVALLVAMYVRDKPFYGVLGLCVLLGPSTILAFSYIATG